MTDIPGYENKGFTTAEDIQMDDLGLVNEGFSGLEDVQGSSSTPEEQGQSSSAGDTTTGQTTLTTRQELLRSKVNSLYEALEEELGVPIGRHYDMFKVEGNQLLYDGIKLTTKKGKIRKASAIVRDLREGRLEDLGFAEYTKSKKDWVKMLINKFEKVENTENISMQSLGEIRNVVDATESLMQSFDGFTARERRGLDLALQKLQGNLKHLEGKMISYENEITKIEGKIEGLEEKKATTPGVSNEQLAIWDGDIAEA